MTTPCVNTPMWNSAEIHAACLHALAAHAAELETEQAVRGLDALSEVKLHPILARGLRESLSLTVLREQPFPAAALVQQGVRPTRAQRERCDLVLLPSGATRVRDAVAEATMLDQAAPTLFASTEAQQILASTEPLPEHAFWLEVKSVGQFGIVDGAARACRGYSSELRQALRLDLTKLSGAEQVRAGGLLLVLFADSLRTAAHDWSIVTGEVASISGVGWERSDSFKINDRIGNRVCFVGLVPIHKA